MNVDSEQLERCLAELSADTQKPAHGIHGPGSLAWQLGREALNFIGGGRAALLQLAHPAVAFAIDQHSSARSDTKGRFQRTFSHVFSMVFGHLEDAISSARRVHRIHQRIIGNATEDAGRFRLGDPYHANDKESLTWVWATLVDSVFAVHERVGRRLSLTDKRRYLLETHRFAQLFGLRASDLPGSYEDFKYYFNKMIAGGDLAITNPAREIAADLFAPARPALAPLMRGYLAITMELLPKRLGEAFALPSGSRRSARAVLHILGVVYPRLPGRFRFLPQYVEAQRRLGAQMPDVHPMALWHLMQRALSP